MAKESIEEKRARHKAFLDETFLQLASLAWESFQEEGRGIVCVMPNPENGGVSARYLPPDATGEPSQKMAEEYDPETQFVLVIIEPDGEQSVYRLGDKNMTPPMAHALLQESEQEEESEAGDEENVEAIFNLFLYIEDRIIRELGAVRYDIGGSDSQKAAFLQMKSTTDLSEAKRYPVPSNYILADLSDGSKSVGIKYDTFQQLLSVQRHLEVFEEAFQDMRAPKDPFVCITPVVGGEPMIETTQSF
jgi:hypothetical protein